MTKTQLNSKQPKKKPARANLAAQIIGALAAISVAAVLVIRFIPGLGAEPLVTITNTPSVFATASPPPLTSQTPTPESRSLGVPTSASAGENGKLPDAELLAKKLSAITPIGTIGVEVIDLETGEVLYQQNPTVAMIPASSQKLLTAIAVLTSGDPNRTLETKTLLTDDNTVVLVGGGDPSLTLTEANNFMRPANLTNLAYETALNLKAQSITTVKLAWDETLFEGPSWNENWPKKYEDQVGQISALTVDRGKTTGVFSPTPGKDATVLFAKLLADNGITVQGDPVQLRQSVEGKELASVKSPTIEVMLRHVLLFSDNFSSEVLLRHAAIADGKPGSFDGGLQTMTEKLQALGLWEPSMVVQDGSGLSRGNYISAHGLAKIIKVAYDTKELRFLLDGLPVAGGHGSLRFRFSTETAQAGRGWVRAKTGTLSQVRTLVGYTITQDGRAIGFAFLVNNSKDDWEASVWVDEMAAAITSCGCS